MGFSHGFINRFMGSHGRHSRIWAKIFGTGSDGRGVGCQQSRARGRRMLREWQPHRARPEGLGLREKIHRRGAAVSEGRDREQSTLAAEI